MELLAPDLNDHVPAAATVVDVLVGRRWMIATTLISTNHHRQTNKSTNRQLIGWPHSEPTIFNLTPINKQDNDQ